MANGLMKLTTFVSRSRLGAQQYLQAAELTSRSGVNFSKRVAVSVDEAKEALPDTYAAVRELLGPLNSGISKESVGYAREITKVLPKDALGLGVNGMAVLSRLQGARGPVVNLSPFAVTSRCDRNAGMPSLARFMSSKSSEQRGQTRSEGKKAISTVEDPFDAPTYNIPEKPVTFAEGASYSFIILAGLGVAAAAGYAVFKELIFQPKEYKIFDKALKRIQNDSQVRVRIGFPITGYGQESRNRAARQRIQNRVWTDEDGVEHVKVFFHIRGPHGAGVVEAVMFKDPLDKQWKYTSLIVQVQSPSPAQLILESYLPLPA